MYGYVFACAEVGLDFQVSDKFMLYPGYEPPAPEPWPLVMHYGITYNVGHFAFDKHWCADEWNRDVNVVTSRCSEKQSQLRWCSSVPV